MRDFSIVVPVRGTSDELNHMERSVPAMAALQPAEILFAVDDGSGVAPVWDKAGNAKGARVEVIRPDPAWGFNLAHVLYAAYGMARHDLILRADVDVLLRPAAWDGAAKVGGAGATCCSMGRRPAARGAWGPLRRLMHGRRQRAGFTGLHWIWRPHYYEDVDKDAFMRIRNGEDAFLAAAARRGHGLITMRTTGADDLDRVSDDYDWSQFQKGVWLGANLAAGLDHGRAPRGVGAARSLAWTAALAAAYGRPGVLSAWWWARRHKGHEIVQAARGTPWEEWRCAGIKPLEGIRIWKDAR